MKVSIITSCYNREKTIRGAVESVLAQDYPDIEYIIVDGASKDKSAQIIREAIAGHEDQVKFISEPDMVCMRLSIRVFAWRRVM